MFKKMQLQVAHVIYSVYLWGLFPRGVHLRGVHLRGVHLRGVPLHRIFGFIFLGLMSRLLPHPPNFTAINAIALFGICSLGSWGVSLFTVFATMLLSDLVFGFSSSIGFVYLSSGLIVLMGYGLKSKRSLVRTTFLLALSSLLFFIVTNFGVWLAGSMYPKTAIGLELCYLAALPFFTNNLIGTLLYGGVLSGWLTFTERSYSRWLPDSGRIREASLLYGSSSIALAMDSSPPTKRFVLSSTTHTSAIQQE